jgi:hypothetical protein
MVGKGCVGQFNEFLCSHGLQLELKFGVGPLERYAESRLILIDQVSILPYKVTDYLELFCSPFISRIIDPRRKTKVRNILAEIRANSDESREQELAEWLRTFSTAQERYEEVVRVIKANPTL